MIYPILKISEHPEQIEAAVAWFSEKWHIPAEAYRESMHAALQSSRYPEWVFALDGGRIVGGLGVIENDFHNRKDLAPNVCAVYTENVHRGNGIAGKLLNMAVEDLRHKGISPVYLVTDHTNFYERYGWEFFCMVDSADGLSRLYVHK